MFWLAVVVAMAMFAGLLLFTMYELWLMDQKPIRHGVQRVLLVTAHPDDECMFFAPVVTGLLKSGVDVHLLCLSAGNGGAPAECRPKPPPCRKAELRAAADLLGVPAANVFVVQHTRLQDAMDAVWPKKLVAELLLRYVETLAVDTVITFDAYGVSGHANHRAIYAAMQQLYTAGRVPVNTQVLVLESVNVLRKYTGMFDACISRISAPYFYLLDTQEIDRVRRAMRLHRSQYVWHRRLYMRFSRYVYVNTLSRMALHQYMIGGGNKKLD